MKILNKTIIIVIAFLLMVFLLWYFSEIIFFIFSSLFLSLIGKPLVIKLNKIRIRNFKFPSGLSAFITLILILSIFVLFFIIFIPILINEAKIISSINLDTIVKIYQEPIKHIENFLKQYNIISQDQTLLALFSEKIMKMLHLINFKDLISYTVTFAGSILISIFSILFITFFFLKDSHLFNKVVLLFAPVEYHTELKHVLLSSRKMLSRYFVGLITEIIVMAILLWIGLSLISVKNALLIAFIGGIMVIVPYIGFLIGLLVALVFGITASLSIYINTNIIQIAINILIVYGIVKLIDDFVLQPLIYSNSVKAHPLEIFLVILMAANIAGITGCFYARNQAS